MSLVSFSQFSCLIDETEGMEHGNTVYIDFCGIEEFINRTIVVSRLA